VEREPLHAGHTFDMAVRFVLLLLIKVAQGETSWNRSHVMRTNKCVVVRNECLNMYVTFSPGHEYRYLCVYVSWMEHGTWTREIVTQGGGMRMMMVMYLNGVEVDGHPSFH
jgi:hypothetical protein